MTPKKISFISILTNCFLVAAKMVFGLISHSFALVAEAVHSIIDIASSLITYIGINAASKPADKDHPYGHERSESIAGFVVVFLLFFSGCWVIYKTVPNIIHQVSGAKFNIWSVIVMALAVVINTLMSKYKAKIGKKFSSVSLVADSQNSKADSISSIAVLIALILVKFYPPIDSILAFCVGIFILYQTYFLFQETIDLLLDTANPHLEVKIRRYLNGRDIQFSELKTRKTGGTNFAEITLHLPPELIAASVGPKIEELEKDLVDKIDELKEVNISVKPVEFSEQLVRPKFGKRYKFKKHYEIFGE
jgi:cation diffusion facilitator family transporter